jgi:hypothetical protein
VHSNVWASWLCFQPPSGWSSAGQRLPPQGWQNHFSHLTTAHCRAVGRGQPSTTSGVERWAPGRWEETSLNLSGGLAVTPRDNLTFTLDAFHIEINDRILLGATFDDDTTLAILARNGYTGVGGVQYFTNGLDTKTQGIDLAANWRAPADLRALLRPGQPHQNTITRRPLPAVLANRPARPDRLGDLYRHHGRAARLARHLTTTYNVAVVESGRGRPRKFSGAALLRPCRERYGRRPVRRRGGYTFNQVKLIGARTSSTSIGPAIIDTPNDRLIRTPTRRSFTTTTAFSWARYRRSVQRSVHLPERR